MVNSIACLVLAAAVLCTPRATASRRLTALRPHPATAGRRGDHGTVLVVLAGVAGLLLMGPGGAVAAVLLATTARRRHDRARAGRAVATTAVELADALRRITDELRSGSHPAAALTGVAADGPQARRVLAPAASAARLGDDIPAALRRSAAGQPEVAADLDRVAGAWALGEHHGVPLAELLASTHEDIRWRARFGATVAAQLAGPRATATVLSVLPVLGIGLGQLLGADPIGVLRGGVLGQVLLIGGVGLVAAGSAWCDAVLRAAVPR